MRRRVSRTIVAWTQHVASRPNLSKAELQAPFNGQSSNDFPVILSPARLADLLGLSVKTVYTWISLGRLDGCYRKRGKHCLIWRDRALAKILDGPSWEK
jgi:hypothetical protein